MTTVTTRKPAPQARGSRARPKAGLKKARADESWDFRKADTKRLTHGIHPYPAMMIPQVAARLISRYGAAGDVLFDPYCGTGTSLLEAKLAGMDAVGTDLNPLARLIASVKTTAIPGPPSPTGSFLVSPINGWDFTKLAGSTTI